MANVTRQTAVVADEQGAGAVFGATPGFLDCQDRLACSGRAAYRGPRHCFDGPQDVKLLLRQNVQRRIVLG